MASRKRKANAEERPTREQLKYERESEKPVLQILEDARQSSSNASGLRYACLAFPVLPEMQRLAREAARDPLRLGVQALTLKLEVTKVWDLVESLTLLPVLAQSLETLEICFRRNFDAPAPWFEEYDLTQRHISWMQHRFPRLRSLAIHSAGMFTHDMVPYAFDHSLISMLAASADRLPALQHLGLRSRTLLKDHYARLWAALPAKQLVSLRLHHTSIMDEANFQISEHDAHFMPARVFPRCRYLVISSPSFIAEVDRNTFPELEGFRGYTRSTKPLAASVRWLRLDSLHDDYLEKNELPTRLEVLEVRTTSSPRFIARLISHCPYLTRLTIHEDFLPQTQDLACLVRATRLEQIDLMGLNPHRSSIFKSLLFDRTLATAIASTGLRRIGVPAPATTMLSMIRDLFSATSIEVCAVDTAAMEREWTLARGVSLWTPCVSCYNVYADSEQYDGDEDRHDRDQAKGDLANERVVRKAMLKREREEDGDEDDEDEEDEDEDEEDDDEEDDDEDDDGWSSSEEEKEEETKNDYAPPPRQPRTNTTKATTAATPLETLQQALRVFLRDRAWTASSVNARTRLAFYRRFSLWVSYDKCGKGPLSATDGDKVNATLAKMPSSLVQSWASIRPLIEKLLQGAVTSSSLCGQISSVVNAEKDTWPATR